MNQILLTVKEVADLRGFTERAIRKQIAYGKLQSIIDENSNIKRHLIPLNSLNDDERRKVLKERGIALLEPRPLPKKQSKERPPIKKRRFDEYTAAERKNITFWQGIIREWESYRKNYHGCLDAADTYFVEDCLQKYPELNISRDILYRRKRAIDDENWDGLIENRGKYNKGQHSAPQEIFDLFMWYYLDDRKPKISHCVESVYLNLEQTAPELLEQMPSYYTFRRYLDSVSTSIKVMGREGMKAYDDKCRPYITRIYDDLKSNDFWIADNHTLDIISQSDKTGKPHRLSLTMFIDVRSGMPVGWNLTDNPNGQSTLLALRHGIIRVGAVPKHVYVDNGREFLVTDIGGLGHRKKKNKDYSMNPPPIFERLGIKMVNALVKNAKAKVIERTFRDFTFDISKLFDTYCGGNILERPESLKKVLKEGHIPLDSELRDMINDLIDGYMCHQPYNGRVARDRGLSKYEVFNKNMPEMVRVPSDGELDLLLMRTTKAQKVGRNGVKIRVYDLPCEYGFAELQDYIGETVFVRYDPANLLTARVYSAPEDRYIMTVGMNQETRLRYGAAKEDIALAQQQIGEVKKRIKKKLSDMRELVPAEMRIDALDLRLRYAHDNVENRQDFTPAERIELIISPDTLGENAMTADTSVKIDVNQINELLEKIGG